LLVMIGSYASDFMNGWAVLPLGRLLAVDTASDIAGCAYWDIVLARNDMPKTRTARMIN